MRIGLHVEALIQDYASASDGCCENGHSRRRFSSRSRSALVRRPRCSRSLSPAASAAAGESPERLFTLSAPGKNVDLNPSYYSHGFYEHLRNSNPIFGNLFASSTAVSSGVNLSDGAVTDRVRCELVSGNYFDVLGVGAAAGRTWPQTIGRQGRIRSLVLSYAFWQRRFAGAPDVVGRSVTVNGTPFTVVGVAKRGFFGTKPGFGPDIWASLMMVKQVTNGSIAPLERNQNYLEMMVRLEPPFESGHAQAMAATIYANWLDEGPYVAAAQRCADSATDPGVQGTFVVARPVRSAAPAADGRGASSPADRLREHRDVTDVASDGESKRDCGPYCHWCDAQSPRPSAHHRTGALP